MGAVHIQRCDNEHTWEVLVYNGVTTSLCRPEGEEDDLSCPTCGLIGARVYTGWMAPTPHGVGYPYYDIAVGMEFESAQHRERVFRERGLRCMEGEAERELDARNAVENKRKDDERERMRQYDGVKQSDDGIRQLMGRFAQAPDPMDMLRAVYGSKAEEYAPTPLPQEQS
jgi:hypothetical protein